MTQQTYQSETIAITWICIYVQCINPKCVVIEQLNDIEKCIGKNIIILSRFETARAKKVTHSQSWFKYVDTANYKSVFERHLMFHKQSRGASSNSNPNSSCCFQMDHKKRIAYICNSNKMRSILLRNVFVLCTYLIYPSVEKYKVFCDMGIAIAVTLIETILDQVAMSSKYIEPIEMR